MGQISFSDAEYAGKRKKTRREVFLEEMELVVPWKALLSLIEPHYPVAGRGRRPYPLESMLRVHLMQNWFALSDPSMEEALYEIASLRAFARLHLGEPIPDETTILNFRHLLEATIWPTTSSRRSMRTWRARACYSSEAASWMPPSSPRRVRPRTPRANATPRCIRPRRATNGISG